MLIQKLEKTKPTQNNLDVKLAFELHKQLDNL
jgi:hypothetical protein